jgi:fumarate reductase subunit C
MEKKVLPNVKLYKRHMNIFWWTNRWIHFKFIARELTSLCVAIYSLLLLIFVGSVLNSPESLGAFVSTMQSPLFLILHVLLLGGLLFHSVTWFNLAPKAMVIKIGGRSIPGIVIALMNYFGWVVISAVLIGLMVI